MAMRFASYHGRLTGSGGAHGTSIDADALTGILGHGQLGALAQSLGLTPDDAASGLARILPDVVDRMTPQGHVPADTHALVTEALERLQRQAS